jgi:tetratricopeptide (TPR) repeat protein
MSDITANVGLAASLQKQGKFDEAEARFREALAEIDNDDPRRADVLAAIAGVLLEQRRFTEAEDYFGKALALLPPSDLHRKTVLVGLAAACVNQGKDGDAETYYRQALAVSDNGVNVRESTIVTSVAATARHTSDEQVSVSFLQTLPSLVRDDLIETQVCLQYQCWNAFGAMARRTVHSICADLGCGKGDLYDQIEDLGASHKLNPDESRTAHEIRTLGRNGAHPEWEPVTEQMATIGWGLLVWLCKHLYEQPPASPNWSSTTERRYRLGNGPQNP